MEWITKKQIEKNIYETKTLPNYQKEFKEWSLNHNQKIENIRIELIKNKSQLDSIYNSTKILPVQYRKIEVITYIYETISSSDYDVKQAIDMHDGNRQRELDEARLQEQIHANNLADEQNDLLYEQNKTAERARKDANRAAFVGAVQHHNTNKTLKSFKKK